MSIRARALQTVRSGGFLPHAVIGRPVSDILRAVDVGVERGIDDFDDFEGAAFSLNDSLDFTLKHYRGHPPDTATVYLPQDIADLDDITTLISVILAGLRLTPDDLIWQRMDDPEA